MKKIIFLMMMILLSSFVSSTELYLHWKMDEASGNLSDSSIHNFTGTAGGNPIYQTGNNYVSWGADSIDFDGDGDNFLNNDVFDFYINFTACFSGQNDEFGVGIDAQAMSTRFNDGTWNGWGFRQAVEGFPTQFGAFYVDGGTFQSILLDFTNGWFCLNVNSTALSGWHNGTQINTIALTPTVGDAGVNFRVGCGNNDGCGQDWNGDIQEAMIFNGTLTSEEHLILFQTGDPFSNLTSPTLSNLICTSCNFETNNTIDSTPTINITCIDDVGCKSVRCANNSAFTFENATSSRNATRGNGDTWVFTLPSSDQLTEFNKPQTIYCWANDIQGNSHTDFNISIDVTLLPINLTMNGLEDNLTYEYETTALINTTLPFIDIIDDTNRFINQISPFNYIINLLRINQLNNTNTSENVTSGIQVTVDIDNRTDLYNATINLTGINDASNISLNYTKVLNFPGILKGNKLFQDKFTFLNILRNKVNISFTTAGSLTIFINFSNQGNLLRNGFLNWTMTAFDLDSGNDLDQTENFTTSDNINLTSLVNVTAPVSIYDDFENNATISRYTIEDGCQGGVSGKFSTGLPDNRLLIGANVGGTGGDSCKATFVNIPLDNISLVNFTALRTNSFTCGFSCTGSRSYSIILTDLTTQVTLYSQSEGVSYPGPGSSSFTNEWVMLRTDNIWIIKQNGSEVGSASRSSLNSPYFLKIIASVSTADQTKAAQTFNLFNFQTSGIRLKRLNGTYEINVLGGVFESNTLFSGTSISRVFLTNSEIQTENTTIEYFASNNNGSTYETVVPGNFHTFISSGDDLKIKFILNSTDNITSPYISSYRVQIIPASPTTLLIDVGNDGLIDMEVEGELNSTTTPISYTGNDSGINNYINRTCLAASDCLIPISFTVGSGGIIQIDNFNLTENINPVRLNTSLIQNLNSIPFKITYIDGVLKLDDIRFDFRGSKNITISAHNSDFSIEINRTISVKYSPFNLTFPNGVDFFEVFYGSRNQSGAEPFGQNSTRGIFNINSLAYDGNITISTRYNQSPHGCLTQQEFRSQNFSFSPLTNISTLNITNLTTTNQILATDINSSSIANIFSFNMINCSAFDFPFIPFEYFCFSSLCSDCVITEDAQDMCQGIV